MQSELEQRLGRFELLTLLGTGGFASVYRARDTQLDRLVAIKLLHPHLAADAAFAQRFQAEARTAARLRHPHIVTVFEVGETASGRGYLVMELLEGTLLAEVIARQAPLSFELATSILGQLASAIDYLHAHGLVHRDIKPANIMIATDGHATLMDFGVARDLDDQAHLTQTGGMVGTPTYMSPEQIGDGATVGPASDRYALGIVAYELFAGRPPFRGGMASVIHDHVATLPAPLETLNLNLPPAAARAIEQMLAKEPAARPVSAASFMSLVLGEVRIEDLPTQPYPRVEAASQRPAGPTLTPAASEGTAQGTANRVTFLRHPPAWLGFGALLITFVIGLLGFRAIHRPAGSDGQLVITTEPAGASVMVDGHHIGVTPLPPTKLATGTHTLVVEKPTYRVVKREESIAADHPTRQSILLESLPTTDLLRIPNDAEHQFIAWDLTRDLSGGLRYGQKNNTVPEEQPFGMLVTVAQRYPGQRDVSFTYGFTLVDAKGNRVGKNEPDTTILFKKDDPELTLYWNVAFPSVDNLPPGIYQVKFFLNKQERASKPVELVR